MTPRPLPRWRVDLRQRGHHRPFRIAAPQWNADERDRLAGLLDEPEPAAAPPPPAADPAVKEKELAVAATNLWRARKKLARSGDDNVKKNRQVGRYLDATQEAFDKAGVLIQDHDGDSFHPGLSLEVLAFQEDPALSSDIVLETVKPSVYLGERRIQMGEVIVGSPTPQNTEDPRA